MSLIKTDLERIDKVVDIYEKYVLESLNSEINFILKAFEDNVKALAEPFKLISKNSIRKLYHFSFVSRLKQPKSLKEKFIRCNLHNYFEECFQTDSSAGEPELTQNIKQQLFLVDDLIGIKILADLDCDCIQLFELIKSSEFQNEMKKNDITFDRKDLESQPQKMKNGLHIYKMKGKFRQYTFELQIKSKLLSAWGDMEHSIFYKEHSISPVRDTAHSSMTHIGKLLYNIDNFVESIRNANITYTSRAAVLKFIESIESSYSQKVFELLNSTSFSFRNIAELMYAIFDSRKIHEQSFASSLRVEHFELSLDTDSYAKKYIDARNKCFELKILESIILSWIYSEKDQISKTNLETTIKQYLDLICEAISLYFSSCKSALDQNEMKSLIKYYLHLSLDYNCLIKFLLDLEKFKRFLYVENLLIDCADEDEETIDPPQEESIVKHIKNLVFVHMNSGNLRCYCKRISQIDILKTKCVEIQNKLKNEFSKNSYSPDLLDASSTIIREVGN